MHRILARTTTRWKTWPAAWERWAARAEAEIRRVIAYLNDEVVPAVRSQSFTALRRAGEQLTRLADELEKRPKP